MIKFLSFIILFTLNYPGKRQVLLFYNEQGKAIEQKQLELLNNNKQGLKERDVEIYEYDINKSEKQCKQWHIAPATAFTFILIGKDGGEKLRSDSIVPVAKLFAIIDAMPMRKEEMKQH